METHLHIVRQRRLNDLIDQHGSVEEFADRTGFTPNYISQLRGGHKQMGNKTAERIARALGLALSYLDVPIEAIDPEFVKVYLALDEDQRAAMLVTARAMLRTTA